jgi:type IV pilus assembly protein PilY1
MNIKQKIKPVVFGIAYSACIVPAAFAEDIEIYTSLGTTSATNPNIMFLIDTSGSMKTTSKVKPPYDYTKTYTGSCSSTSIYFTNDGKLPVCPGSTDYFDEAANKCSHSVVGYKWSGYDDTGTYIYGKKITPGQDGSLLMIGTYSDQLAQFDTSSNKWRELSVTKSSDRGLSVECVSDGGLHGATDTSKQLFIANTTGWTNTVPPNPLVPHPVWSNGAGNVQLFHGNYVNYINDTTIVPIDRSRIEQVKSAVEIMVRGNTRVDIGLQVFDSSSSQGGAILYPILDVGADRNNFFQELKNLKASGGTPLSETYYESLLYFGGKNVDYGSGANPPLVGSAFEVEKGAKGTKVYKSPISSTCDKNYIVVLTDGQPTSDSLSSERLGVLPGFPSSCGGGWGTSNNCLDELAGWAATKDVAEISSIPAHEGEQNITTHTIGFALADSGAIQLLKDTAKKGKGDFYEAKSEAELIDIFNKIISQVLDDNTTFTSPAVSVNAFNRATHLDDLYFTLFQPSEGPQWAGNMKKYKLDFFVDINDVDGDKDKTERLPFIKDALGANAVDPDSGFFKKSAKSFWTTGAADGQEVTLGGAASKLSKTRKVYTNSSSYTATGAVYVPATGDLTATTNLLDKSNAAVTDAMLGITGYPDIISGTPYRETLLDWAKGLDVFDNFGELDTTTDARLEMGDPLHAEPILVQYGETSPGVADQVAYVATNDGYLHAIDIDDGTEIFSFVPQELLPKLGIAMEDAGGSKLYGLDGNVVAWSYDKDNDGLISAADGDHIYLYFGTRRGDRNIYSIDVTDRYKPSLRWVIKGGLPGTDYEELGQTWSTVNVEKIKDGAVEKTVLVFGGGYDTGQDGATVRGPDGTGRTVFIADASTGKRLWSAGVGGDATADMNYSIPARIKPLDISGDGYIDRLYAADMGGQIFRFDINNTNGVSLASSITGGRIADLAGATAIDARRFYYPPDVALVNGKDGKYHALVIGSGFRAHPLNKTVHDRIYMIKDRDTGMATSYTTLTEADLQDVTSNLAGGDGGTGTAGDAVRAAELAKIQAAEGWYINLDDENNSGAWIGEKSLSESLIIEGVAIVTTFTPTAPSTTATCKPSVGTGKVFFLDLEDATPAFPVDKGTRGERSQKLVRGGIPPSPSVIMTKGGEPTLCIGTECSAADFGLGVRKTYWYEVEK